MKQYTSNDQTAKLIELGFEKPKSVTEISWQEDEKDNPIINANTIEYTRHYSIGELIEMLPIELEDVGIDTTLAIHFDNNIANVEYIGLLGIEYSIMKEELIDAFYDMLVRLKEEGVI